LCIAGPGCLEAGRDILITDQRHSYGVSDRAIVDTADSLIAIKKLVYDDKALPMEELLDAKAHPERHRDLAVRTGDSSAYFVMLSPEIHKGAIPKGWTVDGREVQKIPRREHKDVR
jgi:hypothetical protein